MIVIGVLILAAVCLVMPFMKDLVYFGILNRNATEIQEKQAWNHLLLAIAAVIAALVAIKMHFS